MEVVNLMVVTGHHHKIIADGGAANNKQASIAYTRFNGQHTSMSQTEVEYVTSRGTA